MFYGTENVLCADFHEDDIRSDLTDPLPGDDVLLIRSQNPQKPAGPGNDDSSDAAFAFVEDQVAHSSQPFAVAAVDYVFFF